MGGTAHGGRADLAIVGGGASGLLVAAHLLRRATGPVRIAIVEPRADLGSGVAWSATEATHVANVPAGKLSAFPDEPRDLMAWAGCGPTDFLPRGRYGAYLRDVLARSLAAAPDGSGVRHVRATATGVRRGVVLTSAGHLHARRIVLATGHDAPVLPPGVATEGVVSDRIVTDPWEPGALDAISTDQDVVCVGTGLTFVDVALSLLGRGVTTTVHGISRRGDAPIAHEDPWREPVRSPEFAGVPAPAEVAEWIATYGDDWRRAVDALRPLTPGLWRAWDEAGKRAFVRDWSRAWEVHRHRMAPGVGRTFARLRAAGRIQVHGGGVLRVASVGKRLEVTTGDGDVLSCHHVVLCTGPTGEPGRNPLLAGLLTDGLATHGPLGLGLAADPDTGAVLQADGPSDWLFALGPLLRGELWESTAIPEIAVQAERLAAAVHARLDEGVVTR